MNKNENTKYKLAEAIKICMKTKPVNKITVQNIVDNCGLTRQTFYRNFTDKYDLINWYFDKLIIKSFSEVGINKSLKESLEEKFKFMEKEKLFFTEAFRADDYNSLKEHDFKIIMNLYKELIKTKTKKPILEEIEILLEMYCRESVYITVKWVFSGMKKTPIEMTEILIDAIPPKLEYILNNINSNESN